jgi:chromosomal replication initiator protein
MDGVAVRQLELGEDDGLAGLRAAWGSMQAALADTFSPATYANFVRPLQPLSCDRGIAVFGAPSSFGREWAEKKYAGAIASELARAGLRGVQVRFIVKSDDVTPVLGEKPLPLQLATSPAASLTARRDPSARNAFALDLAAADFSRYTFDDFHAGGSNQLAYAGARAVAEAPGQVYSPFFLHGGTALGKTHLLKAIGGYVRTLLPDARVAYVTGESFTNHYVEAVRDKKTEDFRRAYRTLDVLLFDDFQSIATREQTKEEFFHTFDALQEGRKQIVIAADRSPRELAGISDRLRSRFDAGLVADIEPPDPYIRARILGSRAAANGFEIPADVLAYMVELIQDNIRALEGALIKLMAYASIQRTPVTEQLARELFARYYVPRADRLLPAPSMPAIPVRTRPALPAPGNVTPDQVIDAAAEYYGVEVDAVRAGATRDKAPAAARDKAPAAARTAAMYLCRELTGATTPALAVAFGVRCHSTISHAHAKARRALETDQAFLRAVAEIKQSLSKEILC